jgi:hypothetical protein
VIQYANILNEQIAASASHVPIILIALPPTQHHTEIERTVE